MNYFDQKKKKEKKRKPQKDACISSDLKNENECMHTENSELTIKHLI
jgi:hypothetical protein